MAARRVVTRLPTSVAPGHPHPPPPAQHLQGGGATPGLLQARGGGGAPSRGRFQGAIRRRDLTAAMLFLFLVFAVRFVVYVHVYIFFLSLLFRVARAIFCITLLTSSLPRPSPLSN